MHTLTKDQIRKFGPTIETLIEDDNRYVMVMFDDEPQEVLRRYVIVYLTMWWILVKWEVPFLSKYRFDSDIIKDSTIEKLQNEIYKDIVEQTGETGAQYDFWKARNALHKFILNNCARYQQGLSRVGIAKMMKDPNVKKITDSVDFKNKPMHQVEEILEEKGAELLDLLSTPGKVKNNVLYWYLRLGLLNVKQVKQVFLAVGTRADLNDEIIRHAIERPFYKGLEGVKDAVVEFITAKKASFYNNAAVGNASTFSKSVHLMTSAFRYVYREPCGSDGVYMPYHVLPGTSGNLVGKFIWNPKGDWEVTEENHKEIDGRSIWFRTIFGCKHRDGFCVHCAGRGALYKPNQIKAGLYSGTVMTQPTVQSILGTKHLQDTTSLPYTPPKEFENILIESNNKIYIRPNIREKVQKCLMVVPLNNVIHLPDLHVVNDLSHINVEYFSHITNMSIIADDEEKLSKLPKVQNEQMVPFLSKPILEYVKEHYHDLETDDKNIFIPLKDFNLKEPILATTVTDDSIRAFVKKVTNFSGSHLKSQHNLPELFKDFASLLFSKVNINILHLEVMLRGNMITGLNNYQVPVLTQEDIDGYMYFDSNDEINIRRGWGTLFINRKSEDMLRDPRSFIIPKEQTDYDVLMGMK